MEVAVLGCAGSMAHGHHTTSFLVDEAVLIDAGSGVGTLGVDAMKRIDHVLLSHSHLDHVLALPLLADVVMRHRIEHRCGPIEVYALQETLDVLQHHLFNNRLWPDFTRLPSPVAPAIRFNPISTGQTLDIRHLRVHVLPACHVVPAVGFAVWDSRRNEAPVWAFSGDTGPNPQVWPVLKGLTHLHHWVIEVAFADADHQLAQVSGHHCPISLDPELEELPAQVQVHLTHLKPGEWEAVQTDLVRRGFKRPLRLLHSGQVFTL